jgi:leucyl aminopeptidase
MDFKHQIAASAGLAGIDVDALVLVVGDRPDPGLSAPLATLIANAVGEGDLVLKKGKLLYLHQPAGVAPRRIVVSVAGDASAKSFKAAVANGLGALKSSAAKTVGIAAPGIALAAGHAEAAVVAAADVSYLYTHTKPSATPGWMPTSITLFCQRSEAKAVQQGVRQGSAVAAGATMAREFGNRPGNVCTPTWLGQQAKKIGKQFDLEVDVLDRKEIEKLGMGSFLAVAQGSDEPPRFIVARYDGAAKSKAPVVLVGKGITFDTGGISLKPGAEMDEMKYDMCGAASVLGTLAAVASLKARVNLVVLVPTCDNMPSGRAVKPGDVVTSMSGQTIEILNTDAEGRLILCDAIAEADTDKPDLMIDAATLTGAARVALGPELPALFANDDDTAAALLRHGKVEGDPLWQLPLWRPYRRMLDSKVADINNVSDGPFAGAVTAALYLQEFVAPATKWMHIDTFAWNARGQPGRPEGGEALCLRALFAYIQDWAKTADPKGQKIITKKPAPRIAPRPAARSQTLARLRRR